MKVMLGEYTLAMLARIGCLGWTGTFKKTLRRIRCARKIISKYEKDLKELQRDLNKLSWSLTLEGVAATSSSTECFMVVYDSSFCGYQRLIGALHYRVAHLIFKSHVRRLKRILRKGNRTMSKVDLLVAKRSLKPILRPADFAIEDVSGAYRQNLDTAQATLDSAYRALDKKMDEWAVCLDLMCRQVDLILKGKENVSAEDEKQDEKAERMRKQSEEENGAKEVLIDGRKLSISWQTVKDAPFGVGRIETICAFRGGWVVLTFSNEIWSSGDCVTWDKLTTPEGCGSLFQVVDDHLVIWESMGNRYYYSKDGLTWESAEMANVKWLDTRKFFPFNNKVVLAVSASDTARRAIGRGIFKRDVETDVARSRFYVSESFAGPWTEVEALKSNDGFYANVNDIVIRGGKVYAPVVADGSFWPKFKEKTPENYVVSSRSLDGWSHEYKMRDVPERMTRLGEYGATINWNCTWAELTTDGIDGARLFLGDPAIRYAVQGKMILKTCRAKEAEVMMVGRLISVE